jgi:hypothetical protein
MGDLDAKLVITVENFKNALSFGNQTVTVDQDAINIENEGHILGRPDLLMGKVLDLSGENIARWLDRWHPWPNQESVGMVD